MRYIFSFLILCTSEFLYSQDLALAEPAGQILLPISGCSLSSSETISIRIFNFGNTLPVGTTFNVSYTVNAGAQVTELIVLNANFLSHSSFTYTFLTKANLSSPGTYTIDATVSIQGDINSSNNSITNYSITNSLASIGGIVSTDYLFCTDSNNGNLSLSSHRGSITRWETSVDGGLTWRYVSQTTSLQNFLNLNTTTQYRAVIKNGSCPEVFSSIATISIGCSMPLTWISFNTHRISNNVNLIWKTANEINTSHFEIERAGSNSQFQKIGRITTSNSATNQYSFIDHNTPTNELLYRIRQVDNNGNFSYSPTKKVNAINQSAKVVLIKNNPVTNGILSFDIQTNEYENISIRIFNSIGTLTSKCQSAVTPGNNSLQIPLIRIAAGIYYLTIQSKYWVITQKIILE